MIELQKSYKLFEYLKNQETSNNKTTTSNNPSKPVTEELSVRDLCLKFHFVTGRDDAPLRYDILNVFKYMSKGFDKVCEIYLKSLHRLLSSQISDSFRVITEKNISYLLIGDNSQFVLFPKDNVNNFKQTHKKLILEHACNFYSLSIEKKEHVFTKFLKNRKQTKEDVKVQGDTLRSSNDLKDNSGSILGKRKPSESLQSDIVENKKRKKETKQRIPKNKRVDDQIELICDGEDLSDGKQDSTVTEGTDDYKEPTVTEAKVTKSKVTKAKEAEAKDSKEPTVTEAKVTKSKVTKAKEAEQITVTEVKNSKETNVTEAKDSTVTEAKDSSKERDSTVTEANVTEEKNSSKGRDSTVTEANDSIKERNPAVNKAQDHNVDEENDYDSENSSDSLEFNLPNQQLNMTSLFGYDKDELGTFDDE